MYGLSFSHLMDSKRLNPAARPASATNVARRNNPTAGDASKGFSSWMGGRFRSNVRDCAASRDASSA